MRRPSPLQRELLRILAKIASLEMLFGGPLVASNDLRPLIGQLAAMAIAVVPVVMFYVGASALAGEADPIPRKPLRIGVIGSWLVVPMNAYAIARVLAGDMRFGAITIAGVLICSLVIVTYLILAGRVMRTPGPSFDAP